MDRRLILAAFGAALAAPALAQTSQPQMQNQQPPMRPGDMPSANGRAGAEPMSREEMTRMMTHMERTMALGSASLAQSRIAVEKAQNARVKMFAQFEVAEQETIAEIIRSMRSRDAMVTGSTPGAASQSGSRQETDERGRRMVEQLQNAQRGTAFDRMYVEAQITGHRGLLDAQEDYLRSGRDLEHKAIAMLARGQIKEHLALLDMMQNEMGRRG